MKKITFTQEQVEAISYDGDMVITACPGSGKTTVIAEKIRTILPTLADYQGVIAITFTVKASRELRERCRYNGLDSGQSFFGTIDAFCLSEIIYPFLGHLWNTENEQPECVAFADLSDEYKTRFPDIKTMKQASPKDLLSFIADLYEAGYVLLETVSTIALYTLQHSVACKRYFIARYTHIFVDEYQDSSKLQHEIFLELHRLGLTAVAVGDIDQSIYEFRGSNPEYLKHLIDHDDDFRHHIIGVNHRCHPSIRNYASRLIDPNCSLLDTQEIRVYRKTFQGTQVNAACTVGKLTLDILERNSAIRPCDIAILVRNNSGLDFVEQGLSLPCRIYRDDPLGSIGSAYARLCSALLQYRFDPKFTAEEIVADLRKTNLKRSEMKTVRRLISESNMCDLTLLTDTAQTIGELLLGESIPRKVFDALNVVICNEKFLKQYHPIDESEVQVMTLHKSKGLEFEVVFHMDLYDWIFPHREYTGNFDEVKLPNWQQDVNLHYVGITRAKQACVLVTSTCRINSNGESKQGRQSQFWALAGLKGLYNS